MDPDKVLLAIEDRLLRRKLSPAERIVLGQTWNKQTYDQMAKHSGYGDAHLKDTGYKLWREISRAVGQRVTKKSLLFVLQEHLQASSASAKPIVTVKSAAPTPKVQSTSTAQSTSTVQAQPQLQYPSGPLPPHSPLYINRPPNEGLAYAEIQRPGGFLRIKAPQKMGKTSLVFRLIQVAEQQGYQTAHLDLQTVDQAVFTSIDTFLRWFCLRVSQALNISPQLDEYWDPSMGYKVSSELYYQEHLLAQSQTPIVLIISAAEDLIQHPAVAQDFFPLLRSWHEKAKWSSLWRNLRLVIVHATEVYVPLKIHQSPFNVGQAIKLPGFTAAQIYELAARYGLDQIDNACAQTLVDLVSGHPYLVNVFFYHLATQALTIDDLIKTAATPSGLYGTHLRNYLMLLKQDPDLAIALKQIVSTPEGIELDAVTMYRLESLGLIKIKGYQAVPSCEVYRSYFHQQLSF
ncbi:MAG: AAA-like domain-containing protein [Leptolyngbya sp. SIO1E4]|nr:AAA-like domain-containing protein [Leptolyngbya sp. SIO1E4]